MSIIEKAIIKLDQDKNSTAELKQVRHGVEFNEEPQNEPKAAPRLKPANPVKAKPKAVPVDNHNVKTVEIDLDKLHQLGMVTPDTERSSIAEQFRRIKRPLLDKIFNSGSSTRPFHHNLIMITSSLPGEGKTFCAVNLAISIALELDRTVLLIDADVARPAIARYLKVNHDQEDYQTGLMDILQDKNLDLADVMVKTNIDKLTMLFAGRHHKHATELLASHSMSKLLSEISDRYPDRVIIFDSPPLLLSTEARVLTNQMGQIVLVVEAGSTTQHAVREVLSQLKTTSNVSLIYNKAKEFAGGDYYGDYYA